MNAREEWLQERQFGIGGSDAAASLGFSRYKTPYQLFLEKTDQIEPEDLDGVERIQFGNIMEEIIAREYSRRNSVKVRRRKQIIEHRQYPWMRASVDRLVEGVRRGLECKNVDGMAFRMGEWGEPGTDQVPDEYLYQCHHYLAVLDYEEWHLAACVGGNRLVTYIIRRDMEMEEMIIEGEHEFWQRIQNGNAPDPDYAHPSTLKLLARMYPGTDGTEIVLPAEIEHWHQVKLEADALSKQYESVSAAAKNHILNVMGNAALGRLPDGSAYRRKAVTRKEYTVATTTYIDFRHTKAKE